MHVAECIHTQNTDIAGKQQQELDKARNHVPWLSVQDGRKNVHCVATYQGEDQNVVSCGFEDGDNG